MVKVSCIVEKALESLTGILGRGIKNNYVKFSSLDDEHRTEKLFKMLIDEGETVDPNMIHEWASNHEKWHEKEADKLAEIADSVLRGTVKISQNPHWKDNLIDNFREECNNK